MRSRLSGEQACPYRAVGTADVENENTARLRITALPGSCAVAAVSAGRAERLAGILEVDYHLFKHVACSGRSSDSSGRAEAEMGASRNIQDY